MCETPVLAPRGEAVRTLMRSWPSLDLFLPILAHPSATCGGSIVSSFSTVSLATRAFGDRRGLVSWLSGEGSSSTGNRVDERSEGKLAAECHRGTHAIVRLFGMVNCGSLLTSATTS
jgi:hypothetical protein